MGSVQNQSVTIRPFEDSDRPAVVALWKDVFAYGAPHNDPELIIGNKLALQRELFWVALVEGRIVGTVMAGYDGHRGWLYSLAVERPLRRRGIGSALMRHAEEQLLALGCPKINLQILPTNTEVVAIYQKLGYKVEERISMGKILGPSSR